MVNHQQASVPLFEAVIRDLGSRCDFDFSGKCTDKKENQNFPHK
jgi:hypothetical protein